MNLQTDIARIASELERRNDEDLIRVIYDILNLAEKGTDSEVDAVTKERLIDGALRSEQDIKEGRYISIEEARNRFNQKFGT